MNRIIALCVICICAQSTKLNCMQIYTIPIAIKTFLITQYKKECISLDTYHELTTSPKVKYFSDLIKQNEKYNGELEIFYNLDVKGRGGSILNDQEHLKYNDAIKILFEFITASPTPTTLNQTRARAISEPTTSKPKPIISKSLVPTKQSSYLEKKMLGNNSLKKNNLTIDTSRKNEPIKKEPEVGVDQFDAFFNNSPVAFMALMFPQIENSPEDVEEENTATPDTIKIIKKQLEQDLDSALEDIDLYE